MAINVKPNFTVDDVRKRFDAFLDVVSDLQLEALQQLGEECVAYARSEHANNWMDDSGNLRSSIGYMVFHNGQPIFSSAFETVSPKHVPKDGIPLDGAQQGQQLCRTIGEGTSGNALVVVAGMRYAVYVEAKGRDVITGAETHAIRTLPMMVEQLKRDIKNVPM